MTDSRRGSEPEHGLLTTPSTAALRMPVKNWLDLQRTRVAIDNRERPTDEHKKRPKSDTVLALEAGEKLWSGRCSRALRKHELWASFLSRIPGAGGAHTALLLVAIRNPLRFPGQRCTNGCYVPVPPELPIKSSCPLCADSALEIESQAGRAGTMLPPRPGTGVRALRMYLGLAPGCRRRKGVQANWNTAAKSSLLMPDGGVIAQLIRKKSPYYESVYLPEKERIARARGVAESTSESEKSCGDAQAVEVSAESERRSGTLRPFQVDERARKKVADAFTGDLLVAWKQIVAPETSLESEISSGREVPA